MHLCSLTLDLTKRNSTNQMLKNVVLTYLLNVLVWLSLVSRKHAICRRKSVSHGSHKFPNETYMDPMRS
jgi:hypothetical protein